MGQRGVRRRLVVVVAALVLAGAGGGASVVATGGSGAAASRATSHAPAHVQVVPIQTTLDCTAAAGGGAAAPASPGVPVAPIAPYSTAPQANGTVPCSGDAPHMQGGSEAVMHSPMSNVVPVAGAV